MSAADLGLTLLGAAILVALVADVFITVLHHWAGEGVVARQVSRTLWTVAVLLTRGMHPSLRRRLLGGVGPALIPATLAVWATLIVLGFALIYLPWMPDRFVGVASGVPRPSTLADAFYYSGVVFFTLGLGDLLTTSSALRLLTLLEVGGGFALITLAISYFTSIYGAYTQQRVWADSLFFQAGGSADAAVLIGAHLTGGAPSSVLAAELARLRDGVVRIRADYASYPILHYFVAARTEHSLLRLLFMLHDLVLLLDTAVDPRRLPAVAGLGRRSGLELAAAHARDSLCETLQRTRFALEGDHDTASAPHEVPGRFGGALDTLRAAGVPVRDAPEAEGEYLRRRAEWEPVMRQSAALLGERWEDVTDGC